jgi:hypothetical protein
MITFKQARDIVKAMEPDLWADHGGTFYVEPAGYADDKAYWVVIGAEEWLVDKDVNFLTLDEELILVSRKDGSVQRTTYLENPDRFDSMKPVNVG